MSTPDSYDGAPRDHTGGPSWTRVYRKGDRYAHLRADGADFIACDPPDGTGPLYDAGTWYGTGSQAEHEKAAAKPLCPACFRVRELQIPDPRLGRGHGTEMT